MSLFRDWFDMLRRLFGGGYRPVTETHVYGQINKLTNIGHVEGDVYITSDPKAGEVDFEELITLLELRKVKILRIMDETQEPKVSARNLFQSEEEVLSHLEAVRSLFLELHEKNVAALRRRHLTLSHEITSEIHALLWVREANTFLAIYGERLDGISYCIDGEAAAIERECERKHREATVAGNVELYPMSFPKPLGDAVSNEEFSALSKEFATEYIEYGLHGIHEKLLRRDALNLALHEQREAKRKQREAERRLEEAARRKQREEQERREREEDEKAKLRGVMAAEMIKDICTYWVICPFCGERFSIKHSSAWDGEKHLKCKTRLKLVEPPH